MLLIHTETHTDWTDRNFLSVVASFCCNLWQTVSVYRRFIVYSGNALVSINAVALHWTRLVVGWVNCLTT